MKKELIGALFWLAVSVFAAVQGFALGLGNVQRPGPGFFPFWGGLVLGLLSLSLLIRALGGAERLSLSGIRWWMLVLVVGALLGYLVFLEPLGFVLVSFLFLFLLFRLEYAGWLRSAMWSLLATAGAWALFGLWLKTQLPRGPWGF
jgi:putative tricarboxylic transport membrane protein